MQHYTTIEQSKQLLDLGVSSETADMCWDTQNGNENQVALLGNPDEYECSEDFIPMWSLGALLELMPLSTILYHEKNEWWCNIKFDVYKGKKDHNTKGSTPVDAAFEMVCWLKEQF